MSPAVSSSFSSSTVETCTHLIKANTPQTTLYTEGRRSAGSKILPDSNNQMQHMM